MGKEKLEKMVEKLPKFERTYKHWYICSGIGWLFALIALVCLVVSFLTEHWIHYDVAREDIEVLTVPDDYGYTPAQFNKMFIEDSRFFSRQRGIFRTCYSGNETFYFKHADSEDKDGNCLSEKSYRFDYEEIDSPAYEEHDFKLRRDLMRCHLAFYIIGIVCLGLTVILTLIGCFCLWYLVFLIVYVLCFLAAFFTLLAMVFFHYYIYIEDNNMDFDVYSRKAWHQEKFLSDHTEVVYEYSYFLGWVAFACSLICFVIFAFASWGIRKRKIEYVQMKSPKPMMLPPPQPIMMPIAAPPPPPPEPIYVQVPKPVYYPLDSDTMGSMDPTYAALGGGQSLYGGMMGANPYDNFARY